jgi:hypothetical protein
MWSVRGLVGRRAPIAIRAPAASVTRLRLSLARVPTLPNRCPLSTASTAAASDSASSTPPTGGRRSVRQMPGYERRVQNQEYLNQLKREAAAGDEESLEMLYALHHAPGKYRREVEQEVMREKREDEELIQRAMEHQVESELGITEMEKAMGYTGKTKAERRAEALKQNPALDPEKAQALWDQMEAADVAKAEAKKKKKKAQSAGGAQSQQPAAEPEPMTPEELGRRKAQAMYEQMRAGEPPIQGMPPPVPGHMRPRETGGELDREMRAEFEPGAQADAKRRASPAAGEVKEIEMAAETREQQIARLRRERIKNGQPIPTPTPTPAPTATPTPKAARAPTRRAAAGPSIRPIPTTVFATAPAESSMTGEDLDELQRAAGEVGEEVTEEELEQRRSEVLEEAVAQRRALSLSTLHDELEAELKEFPKRDARDRAKREADMRQAALMSGKDLVPPKVSSADSDTYEEERKQVLCSPSPSLLSLLSFQAVLHVQYLSCCAADGFVVVRSWWCGVVWCGAVRGVRAKAVDAPPPGAGSAAPCHGLRSRRTGAQTHHSTRTQRR